MDRIAAFDLDGTLSESDLFLVPSYRGALEELGLPMQPDDRLRQMIGGTVEDNHMIVMPEHSIEEFLDYAERVTRLVTKFLPNGRPYTGVIESLKKLRERGVKVALCSNGTKEYVYQVLDGLGLTPYFDFIQPQEIGCNKTDLLRKISEKIPGAKTVMVGDRHFDVTAARENGFPVIGCLYGLYPDEVQDADVCITAADQIADAVELLIG